MPPQECTRVSAKWKGWKNHTEHIGQRKALYLNVFLCPTRFLNKRIRDTMDPRNIGFDFQAQTREGKNTLPM